MSGSLFAGWPLGAPGPDGRLAFVQDADCLREALWNVLMTAPGERIMRPSFGAGLNQWIGQPNTETIRQLIATSIVAAIGKWEQRASVSSVAVTADPHDASRANIAISYTGAGRANAPPALLTFALSLGSG